MTDALSPLVTGEPFVSCPYCDASVPQGAFCGNCGAHLSDDGGRARLHHYAASPTEHVFRMAVISTLFPHLPRHHQHLFRETFTVGVIVVVFLCSLRLYAPALLTAAALLPVLYLLYMYEVEVWQAHLVIVLLATFGIGSLLGVGYSLGFGHLVSVTIGGTGQGPGFSAVLLPVVAQVLMLVGPMTLLGQSRLNEALDGLSFGVSSALGFTLASVVAGYWRTLTAPLVGAGTISTEQLTALLRAALLAAVVNASTTGIIAASVWLRRHGRSRKRHDRVLLRLPGAVVVGFGIQIALGLFTYYITSLLLLVIIWGIFAALALLWLRVTLHHALLEEGSAFIVGSPSPCWECHHLVPTMFFCPVCGAARSAASKHSRPVIGTPA